MNETVANYKKMVQAFWTEKEPKQKRWLIVGLALIILFIAALTYFSTRQHFVPLYSQLSLQETGQIKETLDSKGISSRVSKDGMTIEVPENRVDALKVELAAEGIPQSGSIDYSIFSESSGFGMTDNEFSVMERAAIQTEIENLIKNIDGVQNANVMITMPSESVWLNSAQEAATAAVVLDLKYGTQLDTDRVRGLYHLISKSVPNLPIDNIVISDQNFNSYSFENASNGDSTLAAFEQQRSIQREIEQDLTRNLQQMLGTMIGPDKVVISVTTDIDFTQENRTEQLVEPVDEENMEGIAVSVERISEAYTGEGTVPEGGTAGTGEGIPNYVEGAGNENSEWERTEDRINNEVNRINRDIIESPYQIRNIGLQVMLEPPEGMDTLPAQQIADVQGILGTIIRTTLPEVDGQALSQEEINSKIIVTSQQFAGKAAQEEPATIAAIPTWLYVLAVLLAVIIIVLVLLLVRNRKREQLEAMVEEQEVNSIASEETKVPELPTEGSGPAHEKRKQLESMAKEKPEEFSKLLRSWLSED
ncbi:flagellar basal-body MS-ring/collar protein FliF [Alkalicoccobacillus porphyridii]|uniref:Flagellar M-ring protein n=1 Tax=Alkalicoccobacillus porphyridii TaxID=2597270 RepID=A0A553ZY79_9BACI|nr:flagellar basal-body MS-ring/collar protein FliF [Alkalicoccobacillus porphyridii]TSB46407.1 flagellar basal body M-ring protein FliF [Alkalicoccobacillus porphyridii]